MRSDCRAIRRQLCEYLDGDLAPESVQEVQRHLAECSICTALLNTTRKTVELCRELATPRESERAAARLRELLSAAAGQPQAGRPESDRNRPQSDRKLKER